VVGLVGDVLAGRGRIDRGFFGAHAVTAEQGLLEMALDEATGKQRLAASCGEVYGLADHAKFGAFSLHPAVPVAALTAVYTDVGADPVVVAALERAGVPVHAVAAEAGAEPHPRRATA
jgi:DeoR/GlpR family transcriptional regulator of sugar metabolism